MSFQRNSTLRHAFNTINLDKTPDHQFRKGSLLFRINASLERSVGLVRERGWNVNASAATVKDLNKDLGLSLKPSF